MLMKTVVKATRSASDLLSRVADNTTGLANQVVARVPGVASVSIPEDLSDVTRVGEESAATDVGLADDCVEKIWGAV